MLLSGFLNGGESLQPGLRVTWKASPAERRLFWQQSIAGGSGVACWKKSVGVHILSFGARMLSAMQCI